MTHGPASAMTMLGFENRGQVGLVIAGEIGCVGVGATDEVRFQKRCYRISR